MFMYLCSKKLNKNDLLLIVNNIRKLSKNRVGKGKDDRGAKWLNMNEHLILLKIVRIVGERRIIWKFTASVIYDICNLYMFFQDLILNCKYVFRESIIIIIMITLKSIACQHLASLIKKCINDDLCQFSDHQFINDPLIINI